MSTKQRTLAGRHGRDLRPFLLSVFLLALGAGGPAAADQDEVREFMGRDLVAAGAAITISGEDLDAAIAAGETVELASPTREDALLAGRRVIVRAEVGDDAYLAGEFVDVAAPVAGRIVAAGETVTLESGAVTGGGVRLFGRRVEIEGTVGGDSWIAADTVRLAGIFTDDVTIYARDIDIDPSARFDGMLFTRAPQEPEIPEGTVPTERRQYEQWEPQAWEMEWGPANVFGVIFGMLLLFPLTLLVTGGILLAAAGGTMERLAAVGVTRPVASIGGGLAVVAIWAVAALLLIFTIIGAPLGILMGLALPLLLMLGYVTGAFALALGSWRSLGKPLPGGLGRFGLLAAALLVLSIVGLIPVVGFIVGLLVTLAGLGAAFILLQHGRGESTSF